MASLLVRAATESAAAAAAPAAPWTLVRCFAAGVLSHPPAPSTDAMAMPGSAVEHCGPSSTSTGHLTGQYSQPPGGRQHAPLLSQSSLVQRFGSGSVLYPKQQQGRVALGHSLSWSRGFAADSDNNGKDNGEQQQVRMSLQDALNRLVDAAVELVQADRLADAVAVLKEGVDAFEPSFPNSPELGELHNQVALLLFFQGKPEDSAKHAEASLNITRLHFGANSVLTGHRLLRLGAAKFGMGKISEAAPLLRQAYEVLPGDDPSRHEAGFYMDLAALTGVRDVNGVRDLEGALMRNLRGMKDQFGGGDSMIISMALAQHQRLVHGALDVDVRVGEEMIKQHTRLLSEINPESEDVAVTTYKLATFYYANDLLPDAMSAVKRATELMRKHYPEDHEVMVLCQHRMGMICAAQGDNRAARQLLAASHRHYSQEGSTQAMLAKEAEAGLAMAKFRAAEGPQRSQQQREALEELQTKIDELSAAIGADHMLVNGVTRYYKMLSNMVR